MRVISGRYKGHRLVSFSGPHIRPTTDRVKETLFNILQNDLDGAVVADLFSGTGALGIEALSRGAAHVVFVESHPQSLRVIRENLTKLAVADHAPESFTLMNKDVFRWLRTANRPFDIVFADPPFPRQWAHRLMEEIPKSPAVRNGTLVALEASSQERLDTEYPGVTSLDRRPFGDKSLALFRISTDRSGADSEDQ
jgi:16S rRNA (guanine966-N2)-methyltransferase